MDGGAQGSTQESCWAAHQDCLARGSPIVEVSYLTGVSKAPLTEPLPSTSPTLPGQPKKTSARQRHFRQTNHALRFGFDNYIILLLLMSSLNLSHLLFAWVHQLLGKKYPVFGSFHKLLLFLLPAAPGEGRTAVCSSTLPIYFPAQPRYLCSFGIVGYKGWAVSAVLHLLLAVVPELFILAVSGQASISPCVPQHCLVFAGLRVEVGSLGHSYILGRARSRQAHLVLDIWQIWVH